jgi:hypothetical protein
MGTRVITIALAPHLLARQQVLKSPLSIPKTTHPNIGSDAMLPPTACDAFHGLDHPRRSTPRRQRASRVRRDRNRVAGEIRDQSKLYGLLDRVRDPGLELVSIQPQPAADTTTEDEETHRY